MYHTGSDLFRDDGIYSAYFVEFSGDGKYAVQVEVASNGETSTYIGQVSSPAPGPGILIESFIIKLSFKHGHS